MSLFRLILDVLGRLTAALALAALALAALALIVSGVLCVCSVQLVWSQSVSLSLLSWGPSLLTCWGPKSQSHRALQLFQSKHPPLPSPPSIHSNVKTLVVTSHRNNTGIYSLHPKGQRTRTQQLSDGKKIWMLNILFQKVRV